MNDEYFMRLALAEARAAESEGEIPIGAVVACRGRVVGRGRNGRLLRSSFLAHAEILALENAAQELKTWRFDNCTMYVTLEPCPMCAGALVQSRVRRLVYGARDPKAGAAGSLYDIPQDPRMPHRCIVKSGVLAKECAELLGAFFIRRREKERQNASLVL